MLQFINVRRLLEQEAQLLELEPGQSVVVEAHVSFSQGHMSEHQTSMESHLIVKAK
jgi:hypothetical protein